MRYMPEVIVEMKVLVIDPDWVAFQGDRRGALSIPRDHIEAGQDDATNRLDVDSSIRHRWARSKDGDGADACELFSSQEQGTMRQDSTTARSEPSRNFSVDVHNNSIPRISDHSLTIGNGSLCGCTCYVPLRHTFWPFTTRC